VVEPTPVRENPFVLSDQLRQEMLAHAASRLPEEACGLVGSDRETGAAAVVLPVENELHSPVRFRMAPSEQLRAFYWLEEHHLDLAAIFHSHPRGPRQPSATDLAEFAYPGVFMLILSPLDLADPAPSAERWSVRAFRIEGELSAQPTASEVRLERGPNMHRVTG
jgi:proteasome lid subunit RPN8/RPN11